ncbi:phytanoyl-CoA dioxygenase [Viridothelium virens]|uniref:Phytanoyl-CoA dioxygenase n=1 Tax=Viridothelium virens TaxID=1048519 RepID=A0A6A6HQ76_VIRVR|nr:phytanoyl-CoA dioxygenase [Viridothelium virens]
MAHFEFPHSTSRRAVLPSDPVPRANVEHVLDHGYVIIQDAFTKNEAEEAKAEIRRLSEGSAALKGRNPFEGLDTTRIYSLLNKTRVFDKFCLLPQVLALNDFFLDPGYMISVLHSIQINPGEKAQALHHDDGYCGLRRPRPPLSSGIIFAFDDFTEKNGATRVIPGSHKWDSDRLPKDEIATPMVCPAGSVVYLSGTVWHSGGANHSHRPRLSGTVQYCQPWIRPIETQLLSVDPRRLPEIPERIVSMMGYSTHAPFIGYVDGLSPIKASQRMVRWLQSPLNPHPPAFATQSSSKL